jgi:hypothetical protein
VGGGIIKKGKRKEAYGRRNLEEDYGARDRGKNGI